MKLSAKITSWQNAGIITPQQGSDILDFEKGNTKPYALYGFEALAMFCLGLGFISVIAANWEYIPAALKLIVDFALLAGVGGLVYYADYKKWSIRFEAFLCLFVILVLASIGLIAQVYQLQSETLSAYLLWSALVFPLLFMTKKMPLPLVMLPVFYHSLADCVLANEVIDHAVYIMSKTWKYSVPLLVTFIGLVLWQVLTLTLKDKAVAFKRALKFWLIVSVVILVICLDFDKYSAFIMCSLVANETLLNLLLLVAVGLTALSAYLGYIGGKSFLIPLIMLILMDGAVCHLGALLSFLVIGVTALYALRNKNIKVLNVMLALTAIRIFVLYLNVFGTLLLNGVGLILTGLLILALIKVCLKLSKYLKEKK